MNEEYNFEQVKNELFLVFSRRSIAAMERRSCDAPPIDDDGYGGMELEIYDAIVHFKKTGEYPPFADQRLNRNAHFHWR